jgi:hypothetical protein
LYNREEAVKFRSLRPPRIKGAVSVAKKIRRPRFVTTARLQPCQMGFEGARL